jgi:hypothetical protein
LVRAGFNAEEIIGKIPILPRGSPGQPGDDKIDSADWTSANPIGSPPMANTIGITGVAAFAALLGITPVFW